MTNRACRRSHRLTGYSACIVCTSVCLCVRFCVCVSRQDVTNKRTLMHAFADWCQRAHKELLSVSDDFPDVEEVGVYMPTP